MAISVTDSSGTEWVAKDQSELVAYLNRTASTDYAAKVLRWYDANTGIPFTIANGTELETWDIGPMPKRPDVRSLSKIAQEIRANWTNMYFGARPYVDAMLSLTTVDDHYGQDSAKSIVRYFLANAGTWRGETARRVKAELKGMIK